MDNTIILGDNLEVLKDLPDEFAQLIYIDPPFNTGKKQTRTRVKTKSILPPSSTEAADSTTYSKVSTRKGFAGKEYASQKIEEAGSYSDKFVDFESFLIDRVKASLHCLKKNGSIMIHLDYREVHYIKVAMDKLIGRDKFMNEIIWAYDYGARSKNKWSAKHDTILWYVMNPNDYVFNYDAMERIPYMAPSLVTADKAAKGKTLTDVIWQTIVPTMGKEKTNYPTQKPLGLLNKIIPVHTNKDDFVLDFFAGSGTTGESAAIHNRKFVLVDKNFEATDVCKNRLINYSPVFVDKSVTALEKLLNVVPTEPTETESEILSENNLEEKKQ